MVKMFDTCGGRYLTGYRRGRPCPYPATFIVNVGNPPFKVCGYHARMWTPRVLYPLDWNLAAIRRWQASNREALPHA